MPPRVAGHDAPALHPHRSSSHAPALHHRPRARRPAPSRHGRPSRPAASAAAAAAADGAPAAQGDAASSGTAAAAAASPAWSATQSATRQQQQQPGAGGKPHVVVVGGGWGGFGAALAAAQAGAQVTLLDASPSPGGLSSCATSSSGQVVEPGIKGFWYGYANLNHLIEQQLGLDPFTPYTRSSFWAPDGLQVTSPLFQDQLRLPTPLGSFFYTAPSFTRLSLGARGSALPLVPHLLRHDADDEAYAAYDALSARELFAAAGVHPDLYARFLEPLLLVTLFAPPEELSAAAALGALYYFALAHQADFDVRWARGPIGSTIFQPFVRHLQGLGVNLIGGQRVVEVRPCAIDPRRAGSVVAAGPDGALATFPADAVVLAVGVPPLQRLVASSPLLAGCPELRGVAALRCSDVLAVRLWLDRPLRLRTPSNVVAGFDAGVGGTLFHLNELQDMYREAPGAVLEFDMYHAAPLLPASDDELVQRMLRTYLPVVCPDAAAPPPAVLDASVMRAPRAVTQFAPGSGASLPPVAPRSCGNVFVAGDCVAQGPGTHGAKGLSQEKAYVTGLQAGNGAARALGLRPAARVLPVEPDEPHVAAAKQLLALLQPPLPVGWRHGGSSSGSRSWSRGSSSSRQ